MSSPLALTPSMMSIPSESWTKRSHSRVERSAPSGWHFVSAPSLDVDPPRTWRASWRFPGSSGPPPLDSSPCEMNQSSRLRQQCRHPQTLLFLACSCGAAPSLSPPARGSGWARSGSQRRSRGHARQARSRRARPGRCRSPEGRGWRKSREDARKGCRPSAVGTSNTWKTGRGWLQPFKTRETVLLIVQPHLVMSSMSTDGSGG